MLTLALALVTACLAVAGLGWAYNHTLNTAMRRLSEHDMAHGFDPDETARDVWRIIRGKT